MPDEIEGTVKDLVFGVNTMTSGKVTFITEPINGVLEGIFINAAEQIQLEITTPKLDTPIFKINNIQGKQFIPLRLGVVDGLGVSFPNVAEKWVLNDVLQFEIKGPLNSAVTFNVRYC